MRLSLRSLTVVLYLAGFLQGCKLLIYVELGTRIEATASSLSDR